MNFKRFSVGTLGLLAAGTFAWGCSDKANDCTANKNCAAYDGSGAGTGSTAGTSVSNGGHSGKGSGGSSGVGGSDAAGESGDGGTGGGTPVCDPTANPDSEPCVIGNEHALFVSAAGNDKGQGTEEKPFATLTKALAVASAGDLKRIFVCAGDYAEADTLTIPNHVEVYGGFNCDDWSYSSKQKAHIVSASPIAATISGAKQGVTLQDLRIDAADAPDGMGASSFGVIVSASKSVVLRRVEINAGKGGTGTAGASGDAGKDGTSSVAAQNGAAGNCTAPVAGSQAGGVPATKTCESEGGDGGRGYNQAGYLFQQDGSPGLSVLPTNGGKGGSATQDAENGTKGKIGALGTKGALADDIGTFSEMGYAIASGGSGTLGKPGQGGGGGGASLGTASCVGASGGAGGMGGCGGGPGLGGGGGGASVALLAWGSSVSIESCTLAAATGGVGGDGGKGGLGGSGKDGGNGGPRDIAQIVGPSGNGGKGGDGGKGGNGAGGTGGPSIAIVWGTTAPTLVDASDLSVSDGAKGGAGGQFGAPADFAPAGKTGMSVNIYPPIPDK